MKVEVRWTTRRDLCYTASIAREIDKIEIIASGPRNMTECGYLTWEGIVQYGGVGWTVWVDGNPEFSFGFTPQSFLQPHLLSAWAWGSEKAIYCFPEINRWGKAELVEVHLDGMGCTRIEARAIWNNTASHKWLEWMGFRKDCDLPWWGKDGEQFVQYRWLRSEHIVSPHGHIEGNRHVRRRSLPGPGPDPSTGSPDSGADGG